MPSPDLNLDQCRQRQVRLCEAVAPLNLDLMVLQRPESVQWLTGVRLSPLVSVSAVIDNSRRTTLVLPVDAVDRSAAADELISYEAKWHSTMRDDIRGACSAALLNAIGNPPGRIGCEFSGLDQLVAATWNSELVDIEPLLFHLRRRKDADELAMMRRANEANRAMYEHARRNIEPGINELEVFNELQAVAVRQLGEPLTYFGQDFQCNSRGGPPRDREARAGELYILDLGVGYRGYFSDNARTFAVDGSPTDEQQRAWKLLTDVFALITSSVKPGSSCGDLFATVNQLLDQEHPGAFNHHLGHGVGLAPHEGPHLNPHWDDTFEEGDFFTVEPGLYHEGLRHGIRLEQNYLVQKSGVELLTEWPLDL